MTVICFTDLDNTFMYSKRYSLDNAQCVEHLNNKEQAFVKIDDIGRLEDLRNRGVLFIPLTTRSIKQFKRIDFNFGKYALVANGSILLKEGVADSDWYLESQYYVHECLGYLFDLHYAASWRQDIFSKAVFVDDSFLFLTSSKPAEATYFLEEFKDSDLVDIFMYGRKIYIIPKKLSKGEAIRRFVDKYGKDVILSAGDSVSDFSMCDYSNCFVTSTILNPKSVSLIFPFISIKIFSGFKSR